MTLGDVIARRYVELLSLYKDLAVCALVTRNPELEDLLRA